MNLLDVEFLPLNLFDAPDTSGKYKRPHLLDGPYRQDDLSDLPVPDEIDDEDPNRVGNVRVDFSAFGKIHDRFRCVKPVYPLDDVIILLEVAYNTVDVRWLAAKTFEDLFESGIRYTRWMCIEH